jgi:hypothetical protein
MAKSGRNSGKYKQDAILSQFTNDIRQHENRQWLNITEQCIAQGAKQKPITVSQVRISQYNPNNPLNGSKNWTKEQHQSYNQSLKNQL